MLFLLALLASLASAQYSYVNCGSSSAPITVRNSNVAPSPIVFDENVTASGSIKVDQALTVANAGRIVISVAKHVVLGYVTIPCDTLQTCDLPNNFCEAVGTPSPAVCAALTKLGLPCGCPVPAGVYNIPSVPVLVPAPPPSMSWLASGSYRVRVELYDQAGNQLICATVYDSVQYKDQPAVASAAKPAVTASQKF